MIAQIVAPYGTVPDQYLDPATLRAAIDAATSAARRRNLAPSRAGQVLLAEQLARRSADDGRIATDGVSAATQRAALRLNALFGDRTMARDAALSGVPTELSVHRWGGGAIGEVLAPTSVYDAIPQASEPTPPGYWDTRMVTVEKTGQVTPIGRDGSATTGFMPASARLDEEPGQVLAFASVVSTSIFEEQLRVDIPNWSGLGSMLLRSEIDETHPQAINKYILGTDSLAAGTANFKTLLTAPGVARSYVSTALFGAAGTARVTAISEEIDRIMLATADAYRPDTVLISLAEYAALNRDSFGTDTPDSTMTILRTRYPQLRWIPCHELDSVETVGGTTYHGLFFFRAGSDLSARRDVVTVAQPLPVQMSQLQSHTYIYSVVAPVRVAHPVSCLWTFVPTA